MSMDDETDSRYTTGDIAKLTGVSVRTVQYYDAKGLLIPNEISDGGRRLYGTAEVERMRVILFLKGLGFKLERIRSILSDERPDGCWLICWISRRHPCSRVSPSRSNVLMTACSCAKH